MAVKFLEWSYCNHAYILTAYWKGQPYDGATAGNDFGIPVLE